jgi:hypothetical protein
MFALSGLGLPLMIGQKKLKGVQVNVFRTGMPYASNARYLNLPADVA